MTRLIHGTSVSTTTEANNVGAMLGHNGKVGVMCGLKATCGGLK
jgi:hypothetical protein